MKLIYLTRQVQAVLADNGRDILYYNINIIGDVGFITGLTGRGALEAFSYENCRNLKQFGIVEIQAYMTDSMLDFLKKNLDSRIAIETGSDFLDTDGERVRWAYFTVPE